MNPALFKNHRHSPRKCASGDEHMLSSATYVCHLGYCGAVGSFLEDRWVVVDILHSNDELGGGLQGTLCLTVCCCGNQPVFVLLLPVQGLGYVDVARLLVNHEHWPRPLTSQHVSSASLTSVHVSVKLMRRKREGKVEITRDWRVQKV